MRRRPAKAWLVLIPMLALLLTACGNNAAASSQVEVTMSSGFRFTPNVVSLKAGQPVVLTVRNKDALLHDFSVDEIPVSHVKEQSTGTHPMGKATHADLHVAVKPGSAGTLAFTPTRASTYTFYCTEPGHRESGMQGTLQVS